MKLLLFLVPLLVRGAASGSGDEFGDDLRRGLKALAAHDLVTARLELEKAKDIRPGSSVVFAALAETYLRAGVRNNAVEAAQRAAELGGTDPITAHALALFWAEAGDSEKTIHWAEVDLVHRDTADEHHLLADAYWAAQKPEEAITQYRKAADLAPQNEEYVFDAGEMQLRHGDFAGAIQSFRSARARFPKSAQIELGYGVAAYGQRQFPEAINAFIRVTQLDPTVQQAYLFLGQILDQAQGSMPSVQEVFATWKKSEPGNYLPWCLHAKAVLAAGGDLVQAESELRKSISLNDAFWQSHYELGLALAKKRDWPGAAAEFSRGVALSPENPMAHFQLARMYEKLGKPELAQQERLLHEKLTAAETNAANLNLSTENAVK